MRLKKILLLVLVFFFYFYIKLEADTVCLKNGRSLEGIIKTEDKDSIELEVAGGTVKFERSQVERVDKAGPYETEALLREWERQRVDNQQRILKQQREEEGKPKAVEFSQDNQSIRLNVILNKKVSAALLLDTGATITVLRKAMAGKLGIDLGRVKPDIRLTLADGRQVNAKRINLSSVQIERVEAKNVEAAVMLDDIGDIGFGDGLLGMSFLKKFNFRVDYRERKLILEKL